MKKGSEKAPVPDDAAKEAAFSEEEAVYETRVDVQTLNRLYRSAAETPEFFLRLLESGLGREALTLGHRLPVGDVSRAVSASAVSKERFAHGLLVCLTDRKVDEAIALHREFGEGVDIASAVEDGLKMSLRMGWIGSADKIRKGFASAVDMPVISKKIFLEWLLSGALDDRSCEVYIPLAEGVDMTDQIREAFGHFLDQHEVDAAEQIVRRFPGVDLLPEIRGGFRKYTESYLTRSAERVAAMAPGVDFTPERKLVFLGYLRHPTIANIRLAQDMMQGPLRGVDLSSKIGHAFITVLSDGNCDAALTIKEHFASGIDLAGLPEYPAAVKKGIIQCLRREQGKNSRRIRAAFAPGLDLSGDPEYLAALRTFRFGESTGYRRWVEKGAPFDPAVFVEVRDRSCPDPEERLVLFESCVLHTVDRFRNQVRAKCAELGGESGDVSELPEEVRVALQTFVTNLHAELSAKIRAVASPELIAAYLQENGGGAGSEFLTQAA